MARYNYIPNRVIDSNGISDGADIYFYLPGTTTPVSIYTDAALATPATNPYVVAAGAAVPPLYYAEALVRVKVLDSAGATVSDDDPHGVPSSAVVFDPNQTDDEDRTAESKLREVVSVKDFGAVGDGSTDDSAAFIAAVAHTAPTLGYASPKKIIYIPRGEYSIQAQIDCSGENILFLGGGGVIKPDLGTAGGNIFYATSGILEFDGVEFDGGTSQPTAALANTYVINVGNSASYMERLRVENCRFRRMSAVGGADVTTNVLVQHCIYVNGVTSVIAKGNYFDTISGAAMFYRNVTELKQSGNVVKDTQWYGTNLFFNVSGYISGDYYNCTLSTGMYWGGAINTVNDQGETQNSNVIIEKCTFAGKYSYGTVIRSQSDKGITIQDNNFLACDIGSLSSGTLTAIGITTRNPDGSTPSTPPSDIKVLRNRGLFGLAGGSYRSFIYINNDYGSGGPAPIYNVLVEGNKVLSPSASVYYTHLVLIHGRSAGVENVRILNNYGELYVSTATPVGGGIGLVGTDSDGAVNSVQIGGNYVKNLTTPSTSTHVCMQIGTYVNKVRNIAPNVLDGGFYGVRTVASSGPTLEYLDDQDFGTNTTNAVFSVALTRYALPLYGSATYDPPSLAAAASTFTDVTVTGAALGDMVDVSFSLDTAKVRFSGYVRVANSVRVLLTNTDTGAVDLGSGTLYVTVRKRGST